MKRIIWAVFGVCLFLSACGSGAAVTTINLTMTDFQFTPNAFKVPSGQEITVNARNDGAVVHNFVIMELGADAGDSFDDADAASVYWQVEVKPGGDVNAAFTAPSDPGEYQVVCSVQGHIMAGMTGKLTVVAGE